MLFEGVPYQTVFSSLSSFTQSRKHRAERKFQFAFSTVCLFGQVQGTLPSRDTRWFLGDPETGNAAAQPPAIAPTTMNGSCPDATASGRIVSGSRCDQSSSQAKNRTSGRRSNVTRSRIVPRSTGKRASRASRIARVVTGASTTTRTSDVASTMFRRWCGRITRTLTGGFAPPPIRLLGGCAQSPTSVRHHPPRRTPGLRSCRSTRRTTRTDQHSWRRAER